MLVKPAQVPCELEAPCGCGTRCGEGSLGCGALGGLSLGHGTSLGVRSCPGWGIRPAEVATVVKTGL